ncbi:CLUMA_CG017495, isoform A [Clunio marinus]|uniref:CLUMA_CG017495, isoform A n=1 Tax=Clunio marinus TaxID=568069 RepID=A0A1J1J0N5_9DIPT|nr:CLUMA_CG017495, isoform A [Clunio marinus]
MYISATSIYRSHSPLSLTEEQKCTAVNVLKCTTRQKERSRAENAALNLLKLVVITKSFQL